MASADSPRFSDSPIPRYLQLAELMRQRVSRGIWPQGHRLPSLDELGQEFGVARVTVRQAVDLLARDGLLSPQQGRGTFVTGQASERWLSVQTSLESLARMYADTEPQIVNIDESTNAPALRPGEGHAASRYVFMRRVHSRQGEPYCVINIHLAEQVFRRSPKRFRDEPVIPILVAQKSLRITKAHQVLTIGTADIEVARLLGVPVNSPVAEVRRVFRDDKDCVVYLGEVTYRGDAVHVEMNLLP
ncbi:GntR family transcriptional regulator [Variovorax dokdonensis]|uniref:GntR family transcriptional regulator n=1 Tax=Variovorax dokdonensis TaxID=344883 RepID=A0ABT7NE74_9BURK|nr:GntR family transcriptional regulator [Variovorax dokdonensis]MDM0046165.1 GntR family transcriptional regulator [Variovorax dokdonensis]